MNPRSLWHLFIRSNFRVAIVYCYSIFYIMKYSEYTLNELSTFILIKTMKISLAHFVATKQFRCLLRKTFINSRKYFWHQCYWDISVVWRMSLFSSVAREKISAYWRNFFYPFLRYKGGYFHNLNKEIFF